MLNKLIERKVKDALYVLSAKLKEDLKVWLYDEVESICHKAIQEMFSEERDMVYRRESGFIHLQEYQTIGGEFKKRAIEAIKAEVSSLCAEKAKKEVNSEEFINQVIKRINQKQLSK